MFFKNLFHNKKKSPEKRSYDRETLVPVIRASICTGEQTAGFKHLQTGKFTEVMLISSDEDLQEFLEIYDIAASDLKREW